MNDLREKARAAFNAAADRYDADPNDYLRRIAERTVDHLALRPGQRVFDFGCGSGHASLFAAGLVGPSGHVTGVDLAEDLLKLAAAKAQKRGFSNLSLERGDLETYAAPPRSADAVICSLAIFFARDMPEAIRRFLRLLAPGGKLAIAVFAEGTLQPAIDGAWLPSISAERRRIPPGIGAVCHDQCQLREK